MNNYVITAKAEATIEFSEIANEFALMNSREQAIFLHELFDSLKFKCKDRYETQLLFISEGIREMNFENLAYAIKTLGEFQKEGSNEYR